MPTPHIVYILECRDGTLYVGHTHDMEERLAAHRAGVAARYTACRLLVRLVYQEPHPSLEASIAREMQIKRWSGQRNGHWLKDQRKTSTN